MDTRFDLLIVGGGINGAGIARDAAGRGLSTCLVEQGDFAQATSSASTKLIHGGLRYLEYGAFSLVRESLRERERLMRLAPHLISPLRFLMPLNAGSRPAWMIALGLFLYDRIGGRTSLQKSERLKLAGKPLAQSLRGAPGAAFAYSDCRVDDARLVIANLMDAANRGADIRPRTKLLQARRDRDMWTIDLEDAGGHVRSSVSARVIVNAGGPWAGEILATRLDVSTEHRVRLVKGSHIVVRKLYEGDHAFLLQNSDKRVIFAIPYQRDFTLIGTTDVAWNASADQVHIDESEIAYLCESVNRNFAVRISPQDIVWSYAGLRPLYDDGAKNASAVTRDYVLSLDAPKTLAPVLTVFGGKLTTYRLLAEQAMRKLAPFFAKGSAWTGNEALPGGNETDIAALERDICARWPFMDTYQAARLARAYGTLVPRILGEARSRSDLGVDFGHGLSEAEVLYLVREEWAAQAEDILWRRSKLGLYFSKQQTETLSQYLTGQQLREKQSACC